MKRLGRWVLAGMFAVGGFAGTALAHGNGEHAEKKVTMDQLPSAVRATFQKEAQGGHVEELESEIHHGKTVYEGEVVKNGKGTELQVSEDGAILKRETTHDEATEHEQQ